MKNPRAEPQATYDTVQPRYKQAILVFAFCGLIFAAGSSQIAYLLDLIGVSGLPPKTSAKTLASADQASAGIKHPAHPRPQEQFHIIPAPPQGVQIDGDARDWNLNRGVFYTSNYPETSGTLSAWFHLMWDADNLYVLARVRDGARGPNRVDLDAAPDDHDFLQVSVQTNILSAINFWPGADGQWRVQLHTLEQTGKRRDAEPLGAQLAKQEHVDGEGCDVELSVPWKHLLVVPYRTKDRPQPGQRVQIDFGGRLNKDMRFGKPLKTRPENPKLHYSWILPKAPEHPFPLLIPKGENQLAAFPTQVKKQQVKVAWRHEMSPDRTWNRELPIVAVEDITIDGDASEWPQTMGVVVSPNAAETDTAFFWLTAGSDAENLYIAASIQDPTPNGSRDRLSLRLNTDRIYQVDIAQGGVLINAGESSEAAAVARVWTAGDGYSLEARVPWNQLGGRPETPFPITAEVRFNRRWSLRGLSSVMPHLLELEAPDTWGRGYFAAHIPAEPRPIMLITRLCRPLYVKDGRAHLIPNRTQRSPFETEHRYLDVLPGAAVIDGNIDDWDLSGGIFACFDVRYFRDHAAAWYHAMYDETGMYFLLRYIDPTPNTHAPDRVSHQDDMTQIRLNTGKLVHFTLCEISGAQVMEIDIGQLGNKSTYERLAPDELGVRMSIKANPDGLGWVQEVFAPWSLLRESGKPFEPGDLCRFTMEHRYDIDIKVADIFRQGGPWVGSYAKHYGWGEARFRGDNNVQPQPCRLRDGQRLRTYMKNGKPHVDWSGLKLYPAALHAN